MPRFPNRTHELVEKLKDFNVKVHSKRETPDVTTDIFVADSIGELGLWYKASEVALIGGTFSCLEGKNPWEALHLDCAITFGPRHAKFKDDFKLLENLIWPLRWKVPRIYLKFCQEKIMSLAFKVAESLKPN